ncbi:MAG: type VI secretion system Vgr family protein [Limnohabitans sp.]|nr:type VI secretion system Vgr family protein [Limnohabitans sp.]
MPIGTKITIEIDGETLYRFTELSINQEVNNHHHFTLVQPMPREFVEQAVDKTQFYIGKPILITAESSFLKTEGSLHFKGIVTSAEMVRNFGVASYILIKGYSPTILLEGNPHIQSFTEMSVGDITNQVLNKYSTQQLRSKLNAKNTSSLPYTVQYNESDFSFLKRLAQKKGEWFFYNGSELFLGDPNKGNTYNLYYGNNVHSLKIDMKAQPLGFSYLGYEPTSADTQTISSFEINHQEQGYTRSAFEASKRLYPETGTHLYSQAIGESSAMPHLSDRVQTQTQGKAASLITAYGESDEPGLRIGDKVKITEPAFSPTNNPADGIKQQYFGEYIITQVTHHLDETGKYFNTFEGVPSSVQAPPYTHVLAHPLSGTQPATVTDNNDPQGLGRVKVKFAWQREENSPWLRMTNPHAGGGKGMYFIPEIGEEVQIGFENNNAEKPFVLGAVYNGNERSGYATAGNDNKVIHSRSGTKIILNDAQGSVFVEDPSGNIWTLDGQGTIRAKAPKDIIFEAGENISFNAGKNFSVNAGNDIFTDAGKDHTQTAGGNKKISAGGNIDVNATGNIQESSTDRTEIAQKDFKRQADTSSEIAGQVTVFSSEKDMTLQSGKQVQVNSADKTNQF